MSTARLLPYLPACSVPERVPGLGVLVPGVLVPGVPGPGGCTWSQGGVPGSRGYLVQGVYLVLGGVPGPKGVYLVPGGTCPGIPPPCEQNDRQVQKYYLAPNFVCGR